VTALLQVVGLRAGYAGGTVLHGVDLTVEQGRAVALLGRNGAGKSTLLAAVMGLLRPTAGTVSLQGRDLAGRPAHQVARAGVALVPQGRRVFADLTVAVEAGMILAALLYIRRVTTTTTVARVMSSPDRGL